LLAYGNSPKRIRTLDDIRVVSIEEGLCIEKGRY
jgi:hypothetical protein